MEFFRDSTIDFMGSCRIWLSLSCLLIVLSLVYLFGLSRLNIGIDFVGGTELILRFQEEPDLEQLRGLVAQAAEGESRIQTFGESTDFEVMIKTPAVEGSDEGSGDAVTGILDRELNGSAPDFDLNRQGSQSIAAFLFEGDPEALVEGDDRAAREHYVTVAEAVMERRQRNGVLSSWTELDDLSAEALPAASRQFLEDQARLGSFAVLSTNNVGPQIGSELRTRGILAVAFSLVAMLAYIWVRFELRFGIGALIALLHDVTITLGLYAIAGYEFNLTTIAAFLTVVGYSVNDSVVVFDRVRENLRRFRREPLEQLLNRSLNQTLSRTVLTSGTTLMAVGSLFVLGGDVIRGFAFVLMIGVLVGTYSSIFIASPIVLLWQQWFGREARSS